MELEVRKIGSIFDASKRLQIGRVIQNAITAKNGADGLSEMFTDGALTEGEGDINYLKLGGLRILAWLLHGEVSDSEPPQA